MRLNCLRLAARSCGSISEFDALNAFVEQGLKNVTDVKFEPDPRQLHATSRSRSRSAADLCELDFIFWWLPNEPFDELYLRPMNQQMQIRHDNKGAARRPHRGQVSRDQFWRFILRYMLENLQAKGRTKGQAAAVERLKARLLGQERAEEISASCNWTEAVIEKMHLDFNARVPLLVDLGSVFIIDETILAYFGLDAQLKEILRLFPKKPHDFGLLSYRATVRLHHTKGRIIVSILPITPGKNYTPTSAALAIMDLLARSVRHPPHFIMDSAFATEELFSDVQSREGAVSLSLKENRAAGFGPLYRMATADLPVGETRTYVVNDIVIQAQRKKSASAKSQEDGSGHLHVVLSTGWHTPTSHSSAIKRLGKLRKAQDLYLDWTESQLRILLRFEPQLGQFPSARDMIRERTGWDVLAPEADPSGSVRWTEEALMKLPNEILADILREQAPTVPASGKNKTDLVHFILAARKKAGLRLDPAPKRKIQARDIVSLREQIGSAPSPHSPVLDFYSAEYGAVDETNQEIYRSIALNCHRSWTKLLGFSVLHALLMNAWADHREWRYARSLHDAHGRRIAGARDTDKGFAAFIIAAAEQLVERGGRE